jgi:tetratricopeptide (TPR) repeat protein
MKIYICALILIIISFHGNCQNENALSLKELGNKFLEKKDWNSALLQYNKAYAIDSNLKGVSWGLSIVYKKKGNIDKSIYYASKYIQLDKSDKDGWMNRSSLYTMKHMFKEALFDINEALAIDPNDKKAKMVKSILLLTNKN